jgi:hypothetical protein
MFNPKSLAQYMNQYDVPIHLNDFLSNFLTLIKINITYYMNEISYLMNDLYSKSPSANPLDSMKNYTPMAHAPIINGYNIHTDILAVTVIFHRSHVPSICEIFEFIYKFIDRITTEKINEYLNVSQDPLSEEVSIVKNIAKTIYQEIFKYFIDVYNNLKFDNSFEQKPTVSQYTRPVQKYLEHFLLGNLIPNVDQPSISPYISQMEFYFATEMLNIQSTQKFYYNILENHELIGNYAGGTTLHLLNFIIDYFRNLDENKLYYNTFSLDRYYGEPYLQTSYNSRFYGRINEPLEAPTIALTDPFGVNPSYYDNNNTEYILSDEIPIYWTTDNNNNNHNINKFTTITKQSGTIDFYRIRHEIFHHPSASIDNNVCFIDEYQLNILAFLRLSQNLLTNNQSIYTTQWLQEILK